jgi:magnesium transporter
MMRMGGSVPVMRRMLHQRFRKVGLPPGSLVRMDDGERQTVAPTILAFDYLPDALQEKKLESIEEIIPFLRAPNPTWVDISGSHSLNTYQRLGEIAGLHPLTLEDMLSHDQRPKTEEFESYLFIILKKPIYAAKEKRLELEQVSIVLTANVVFSLHVHVPSPTSPIRSRMLNERARIRKLGTDYLAYVIVDSIVDEYFVVMETMEDQIQDLETALSEGPTSEVMQNIHRLKQQVVLLRRSVWPLREVIAALTKTESLLFDESIKVYLKDLQDHIVQVIELIDMYRDVLAGMLDLYLSTMSHRMNQIMKTLTMIASIFIPLTVVTGIYGMNFQHMPELSWKYGYPTTLGIMGLIAIGMLWFFRRRGWL